MTAGLREGVPTVTMRMEGLEYVVLRRHLRVGPLPRPPPTAFSQELIHVRVHVADHVFQTHRTGQSARGCLRPVPNLLLRERVEGHELGTHERRIAPCRETGNLRQPGQDLAVVETVEATDEGVEGKSVPVVQPSLQRPSEEPGHPLKDILVVVPDVTEYRDWQTQNQQSEVSGGYHRAGKAMTHIDHWPFQRHNQPATEAQHPVDESLASSSHTSIDRPCADGWHDSPSHPERIHKQGSFHADRQVEEPLTSPVYYRQPPRRTRKPSTLVGTD